MGMIGNGIIGGSWSGGPVANPILLPDGLVGAPSLGFASESNMGLYKSGSTVLGISIGGTKFFSLSQSGLSLENTGMTLNWAGETFIRYDASNVLTHRNNNFDQHVRIYGANGTYRDQGTISELLTIAAAASSTTTMSIPANAIVYGVSVRVTVAIPTAATFTVTGNASATQFDVAGGVSTVAGTTDAGTANCPYKNGAAQTIKITPNLQPADNTGRVRITIHYYFINPATS